SAGVSLHFGFYSEQAANLHDLSSRRSSLSFKFIDHELACHPPNAKIVRADESGVVRLGNVTLQANNRNMCCHRLPHDLGQRGTLVGSDDQKIGLLANKRLNLCNLLTVVLLCVGDDQLNIALFREQVLHQLVLGRAIRLCVIALAKGNEVLVGAMRLSSASQQGKQEYSAKDRMYVSSHQDFLFPRCCSQTAAMMITALSIN